MLNYNSSIALASGAIFSGKLYWMCTGKYTPSFTGSIFSSTLQVELDLYRKILPSELSNTGELNFNIVIVSNLEWTSLCIKV